MGVEHYLYNKDSKTKVELGKDKSINPENIVDILHFIQSSQPFERMFLVDDFGDYYDEVVRYYKDFKVEGDCKNFELDLQESTYDKIVIRRIKRERQCSKERVKEIMLKRFERRRFEWELVMNQQLLKYLKQNKNF